MNRCRCGHDRPTHLQDSLGAECTNRYCACESWRDRPVLRPQHATPTVRQQPPEPGRDPAIYDRLEPCPSPSSIRRHTIRLEACPTCGVDGPVRKAAA